MSGRNSNEVVSPIVVAGIEFADTRGRIA